MTEETKRDKFIRMSEARLPKAVKAVDLLANLGRTRDYEYKPSEARDLIDNLYDAVERVADAFGIEEPVPDENPLVECDYSQIEARVLAHTIADGGPVSSYDKEAIRDALEILVRGDTHKGTIALRKVVLGWVPPEREKDDE